MKRRVCITMILCAALLLAALPVHGAADWGESVDSVSALLGRGARLTANTYWTGGSYRTEHYIELSPGAAIRPVVASRDALCSVASMAAMAAELEEDTGLHVVAGINGGFYSTTDLVPVGIVIRDGSPRCSDSGYEAIGFRADGSFIAGKPASMLSLWSGETLLNNAMTLNVTRGPYLTVYTPDACVKTMAAGAGWNLFCSFDRALPMKGDVALWVERIEAGTGAVEVAPDRVVLSFAGDIAQPAPEWLAGIREGDALTLRLDCAPGWENVESGLCLLFPLVKDGAVVPGLEQTAQPRSALGIRADGTLLLYAIDGRLPGHSVGAGLDAVARRLAELGCVYAGALDGGGSTLLSAVLPGMETLDQINRPSGGVQRSVVNYIFLATSARPTG
ncbi:MAG: phosphodiester glycosidase family protein, partial [Oscillospiraceae bacterium]|nr:phosphodiester glycosidase family protein [Oscillospiraceae bacterium]